ncbi:sulfite exporter TauE/SafE family protein [Methylomonas sp. LL1]|uniref:sulfite exporter TauE/SafE family protein n=1 Tax=Methylomonas sp. LL1 TaxID=2785785 RepID=UPI0018C3DE6C|nr:sulfite exporter TauE/SafE family protein [Methylomonas sp. LL1]QPK63359.1 sulfite exporter TauE/SafE family protein [Methylomonas sp. LL1]
MLMTLSLSMIIGLLLGLLGGGGSILTVPMLVYLLHVEPKTAITTSFVVVGLSSLMALIPHARRHSVCWKSGVFFGLSGMAGAFAGGRLASYFSADLLMSLFGLISFSTGLLMLRGSAIPPNSSSNSTKAPVSVCPLRVPYLRVLFDGFFVGGVTGMVGVGGGFLIVPALTLLVGLPMQGAVGTSLFIIVMNALAGLAGYSQHAVLDLSLITIVTSGALVGSAMGAIVSGYLKPAWLRRGFGLMVVAVGIYVLSQSLTDQLIISGEVWLSNARSANWTVLALLLVLVLLRIGSWIHKTDVGILPPQHPADGR